MIKIEYIIKQSNPITTTAKEIFEMEEKHSLTRDMEAQDLAIIAYLDLINYQNGHSFEPPIMTRNAMFWMGMALPSVAYIDSKKTRQSIYYLYSAHNNIAKPYLSDSAHPMESSNMALLQKAMCAVLYCRISGRNDLDFSLREYGPQILEIYQKNAMVQKAWGIDTVIGKFEPFPTLLGLMILTIYDEIFGTSLSKIRNNVLSFVEEKLIDPTTGLFYRFYNTGYMGYPGEQTIESVTWHSDAISPSGNGLALPLYNYFAPQKAEEMWKKYKAQFLDELLCVNSAQISQGCGTSFISPLGNKAEAFLSALLCAKEFDDIFVFERLQNHLYKIGSPNLWEGQVHYINFGEYAHFIGAFAYLARIHISWKKLLSHPWEKFENYDFFTKV